MSKLRFYAFASNAKVAGKITNHRIPIWNATLRIVRVLAYFMEHIHFWQTIHRKSIENLSISE